MVLIQWILVLTNLGEKMSDDEVDELLKAVDTSSGEINYMGMFQSPHLIDKMYSHLDRSRQDHSRKLISWWAAEMSVYDPLSEHDRRWAPFSLLHKRLRAGTLQSAREDTRIV